MPYWGKGANKSAAQLSKRQLTLQSANGPRKRKVTKSRCAYDGQTRSKGFSRSPPGRKFLFLARPLLSSGHRAARAKGERNFRHVCGEPEGGRRAGRLNAEGSIERSISRPSADALSRHRSKCLARLGGRSPILSDQSRCWVS
jgi:hypothetical protein